ncbi:uncharacterized protein METZ01_LOCUS277885 [marine metagenome]|uniref:Uncharacterized protein n=1 Tax=marine metagenome TaxID=408172 RepID=A0A382KQV5_9ZZZZ
MFVFWNVFRFLSIIKDNKLSKEMMLYTYTVIFLIGIAGIFSRFFDNVITEIFLGLLGPVLVGFVTVFFMIKYSNSGAIRLNRMLVRSFGIKFIFYGIFIITIFTVYPFKPIPFMCSFTSSFIGLHLMEAIVLKKIQGR